MDKKYYLNQFKSYAYTENALLFKKYTAPVADYVATNIADIKYPLTVGNYCYYCGCYYYN